MEFPVKLKFFERYVEGHDISVTAHSQPEGKGSGSRSRILPIQEN